VAPATDKSPPIEYRHNVADAVHELGVRIDGAFVAFATLSDARVAQLVEREQARMEAAGTAARGGE